MVAINWQPMIDRAADAFGFILPPVAILFGIGLALLVLDGIFGFSRKTKE